MMPSLEHLRTTRDLTVDFLRSVQDRDWSTAVPELDFDVTKLVGHMSQTNFWYAIDLAAGGKDLVAVVPEIQLDKSPSELTDSVGVGVDVLAAVIEAASAGARGFHPFGQADRTGYAAMACDEMLVHTHDLACAFGTGFAPPAELAEAVLSRLFPWIDPAAAGFADTDPWTLLLFANGRISLPGHERRRRWRWHCAPLAEWDGTTPG